MEAVELHVVMVEYEFYDVANVLHALFLETNSVSKVPTSFSGVGVLEYVSLY